MDLQTLRFDPNFSCEIAPEYPGSGDWGCPVYRFVKRGVSVDKFEQIGEPFVIRLRRDDGSEWVGFFARGFGGLKGVYACPNPDQVCVVVNGLGFLIDSRSPFEYQALPMHPVLALERVNETGLVLCSGFIDLLLCDGQGLLWVSDQLCLDDLTVRHVDGSTIHCSGRVGYEDAITPLAVSLESGQLLSGQRFKQGQADRQRYWRRSG